LPRLTRTSFCYETHLPWTPPFFDLLLDPAFFPLADSFRPVFLPGHLYNLGCFFVMTLLHFGFCYRRFVFEVLLPPSKGFVPFPFFQLQRGSQTPLPFEATLFSQIFGYSPTKNDPLSRFSWFSFFFMVRSKGLLSNFRCRVALSLYLLPCYAVGTEGFLLPLPPCFGMNLNFVYGSQLWSFLFSFFSNKAPPAPQSPELLPLFLWGYYSSFLPPFGWYASFVRLDERFSVPLSLFWWTNGISFRSGSCLVPPFPSLVLFSCFSILETSHAFFADLIFSCCANHCPKVTFLFFPRFCAPLSPLWQMIRFRFSNVLPPLHSVPGNGAVAIPSSGSDSSVGVWCSCSFYIYIHLFSVVFISDPFSSESTPSDLLSAVVVP